jgi:hypothetical protein
MSIREALLEFVGTMITFLDKQNAPTLIPLRRFVRADAALHLLQSGE